jgi:DNA mismatch repair ATPase MutS
MVAKEFFESQQRRNQDLRQKFHQHAVRVAAIRVSIFIAALIVFVYFVNTRELQTALLSALTFLVAFIALVKKHNALKFSRDQHQYLSDINREELARLQGDLSSLQQGLEFLPKGHAYAEDLDLLGSHSLFQLLNRTSTYPGKELLALRLLGLKMVPNLAPYQESVVELAGNPAFIQEYQALGRHVIATTKDYVTFRSWLAEPPKLSRLKVLKFLSYFLPALFTAGFILTTVLSITYYTLLPLIIINLVILSRQHKYAHKVVASTTASLKMLKSFVLHIELVERQKFSSAFLHELANNFNHQGCRAKHEINKIAGLLEQLQARNNIFHVFVNVPLLLDIHWLRRIEQWQKKNRLEIQHWFATLAEFEVLNSLAGQAFSQENWAVPTATGEPYYLACKQLGHPLIKENSMVTNDFAMHGKGTVILLTGPNMAGKSTFLRTVAVNIIMARMGGVVCASNFTFNPEMQVFTAMRIKDDLSERVSSFYAELSRIKQLLSLVQQGVPVLYFLDEILKGTNSADRHKGAEALMRQLSELGATGFVSTHDLELGKLAAELDKVHNYSFESIIKDSEINFDYKLREGICQSFNACELMRQMGIKV